MVLPVVDNIINEHMESVYIVCQINGKFLTL